MIILENKIIQKILVQLIFTYILIECFNDPYYIELIHIKFDNILMERVSLVGFTIFKVPTK